MLAAQGAVLIGLGAILYVSPSSADEVWPWALTPLTSEAVGAFLLGFGVAALGAMWENDLDRLQGSARAYAALGGLELAALAIHSDDLTASGLGTAAYAALWVVVLGTAVYGLIAPSAASRS